METRANYVLIGAVFFIATIALLLFTLWIARAPFNRDFNAYDVVFVGPVNGLSEGGEVRFNGIQVGEVKNLTLDEKDPNRVVARVHVAAQTPVRTDSVAQLDFLGITGVTFIQIRAGSAEKPLLLKGANGEIPILRTERTALDELFSGGQDLMTVSGDTLTSLNRLLSEDNVAAFGGVLQNLEVITAKLAEDDGAIDNAADAFASIDRAATTLNDAASSITSAADGIANLSSSATPVIDGLGPAVADAQTALASLSSVAEDLQTNLSPTAGQAMEQVSLAASDLRALMVRVQVLLGDIEQDPSRFVVRSPQPVE